MIVKNRLKELRARDNLNQTELARHSERRRQMESLFQKVSDEANETAKQDDKILGLCLIFMSLYQLLTGSLSATGLVFLILGLAILSGEEKL